MRLITEITEHVEPLITEEVNGGKCYYITGPFLQADIKNRNGRVYPFATLQKEVNRYTQEQIAEQRALGELGHPDSPQINLDRVSHLITELRPAGRDFHGKAKIMDTPNGRIVKSLIDEGVKLGVSSRGLGTLTNTSEGSIVGEDFYLATAADIVADPSAPDAFVRGIMENKEWVWDNGRLTEAQIANYKKELTMPAKKSRTQKRLDEAKVFSKFIEALTVSVGRPKMLREWGADDTTAGFHVLAYSAGGARFEDHVYRLVHAGIPKDKIVKFRSQYIDHVGIQVPAKYKARAEKALWG